MPKRPLMVGSVNTLVSYFSSNTSYVICSIIAVAFSSFISDAALIINSSGLSLN